MLDSIYFLILIHPYLYISLLIILVGFVYYILIERKNKITYSILWGSFLTVFGLVFFYLLNQLEIQTFREDLELWKNLSLIIILFGTMYSCIIMSLNIKSLRKK